MDTAVHKCIYRRSENFLNFVTGNFEHCSGISAHLLLKKMRDLKSVLHPIHPKIIF
jgi:hypothetical protein